MNQCYCNELNLIKEERKHHRKNQNRKARHFGKEDSQGFSVFFCPQISQHTLLVILASGVIRPPSWQERAVGGTLRSLKTLFLLPVWSSSSGLAFPNFFVHLSPQPCLPWVNYTCSITSPKYTFFLKLLLFFYFQK